MRSNEKQRWAMHSTKKQRYAEDINQRILNERQKKSDRKCKTRAGPLCFLDLFDKQNLREYFTPVFLFEWVTKFFFSPFIILKSLG